MDSSASARTGSTTVCVRVRVRGILVCRCIHPTCMRVGPALFCFVPAHLPAPSQHKNKGCQFPPAKKPFLPFHAHPTHTLTHQVVKDCSALSAGTGSSRKVPNLSWFLCVRVGGCVCAHVRACACVSPSPSPSTYDFHTPT